MTSLWRVEAEPTVTALAQSAAPANHRRPGRRRLLGGSIPQVKVVGYADRLILSRDAVRSFAKRTMLLRHVNPLPRPAKRVPSCRRRQTTVGYAKPRQRLVIARPRLNAAAASQLINAPRILRVTGSTEQEPDKNPRSVFGGPAGGSGGCAGTSLCRTTTDKPRAPVDCRGAVRSATAKRSRNPQSSGRLVAYCQDL